MTVHKPVRTYRIFFDDQELYHARLLTIDRQIYPTYIDTATFELNPRVQFNSTQVKDKFINVSCRIEINLTGYGDRTLHQGYIAGGDIGFNPSGDTYVLKSRLEPFMFGNPHEYAYVAQRPPVGEMANNWGTLQTDLDTVFNPVFDGRIQGNKFDNGNKEQLGLFDLDSLPTGYVHNQKWSLRDAAYYLMTTMNASETFVNNCSYFDLSPVSDRDDILVDVKIPRGVYLTEALRILLEPQGYMITTRYDQNESKPKLYIVRRSSEVSPGTSLSLEGLAVGQPADFDFNPTPNINLNYEQMKDSATQVRILGDYEVKESTFELVPGWDKTYDSLRDEPLKLRLDSEFIQTNSGAEYAWRKWVLNEAGDYNQTDRGLATWDPTNLFELFPNIHKRRKFLPTIANHRSGGVLGPHDGILIEWYHPEKGQWFSVSGSEGTQGEHYGLKYGTSVRILERECGIMFTGVFPPPQIMNQGMDGDLPKGKIRVTASIQGDQRIRVVSAGSSPMNISKTQLIQMGSRFKFRSIGINSEYKEGVNLGNHSSSETDGRVAMQGLASELADSWGHANIAGEIEFPGVDFDFEYAMGNQITKIANREIAFQLDTEGTKAPSLIGWRMDYQKQTTTLKLGTLRGRTS